MLFKHNGIEYSVSDELYSVICDIEDKAFDEGFIVGLKQGKQSVYLEKEVKQNDY